MCFCNPQGEREEQYGKNIVLKSGASVLDLILSYITAVLGKSFNLSYLQLPLL